MEYALWGVAVVALIAALVAACLVARCMSDVGRCKRQIEWNQTGNYARACGHAADLKLLLDHLGIEIRNEPSRRAVIKKEKRDRAHGAA